MLAVLFAILVLAAAAVLLRMAEKKRRTTPGPSGLLEYRTDLPLDVCLDYLDHRNIHDEFAYDCTRQADGSFLLHLTQHRPTQQPVDTLYTLRLEAGRRTVITLIFLREAFGYSQPVFGPELLDRFFQSKLQAQRTK